MASGPITSWQIDGETMEETFSWAPKSLQMVTSTIKTLAPWNKSYNALRQHIKKPRDYFANKGPSIKAMVFPGVMYGCES